MTRLCELDVRFHILWFRCCFFKNSQNHANEVADNINLLHNVFDQRVLSSQLQLVLL
jgi:hypothetical protein